MQDADRPAGRGVATRTPDDHALFQPDLRPLECPEVQALLESPEPATPCAEPWALAGDGHGCHTLAAGPEGAVSEFQGAAHLEQGEGPEALFRVLRLDRQ